MLSSVILAWWREPRNIVNKANYTVKAKNSLWIRGYSSCHCGMMYMCMIGSRLQFSQCCSYCGTIFTPAICNEFSSGLRKISILNSHTQIHTQLTKHVSSSTTQTQVLWALTTLMQTTSVVKCLGQSGGTLPHRAAYQKQYTTSGKWFGKRILESLSWFPMKWRVEGWALAMMKHMLSCLVHRMMCSKLVDRLQHGWTVFQVLKTWLFCFYPYCVACAFSKERLTFWYRW